MHSHLRLPTPRRPKDRPTFILPVGRPSGRR